MRVAITLLFLSASLVHAAKNDDINFDDLQRSSGELSKTVTIPKIASEANAYMRNYLDDDSARIEKLNAWRGSGSGSDYSSSSGGDTNSKRSSSSDNYTCSLRCTDNGVLNETKGQWMKFSVNASSKSEAQEIARNLAKKECTVVRHEWGGVDCKKN